MCLARTAPCCSFNAGSIVVARTCTVELSEHRAKGRIGAKRRQRGEHPPVSVHCNPLPTLLGTQPLVAHRQPVGRRLRRVEGQFLVKPPLQDRVDCRLHLLKHRHLAFDSPQPVLRLLQRCVCVGERVAPRTQRLQPCARLPPHDDDDCCELRAERLLPAHGVPLKVLRVTV
eukprot:791463-Pleurochrysis_carterae.AAC.4